MPTTNCTPTVAILSRSRDGQSSMLPADNKVTRDGEKFNIWKEISRADLSFLTANRPPQVGAAYRKVLANANPFQIGAARRNLLPFRELGILSANVEAALNEMNHAASDKPAALAARVILFTGHMLDAPGRDRDRGVFQTRPRLWQRLVQ